MNRNMFSFMEYPNRFLEKRIRCWDEVVCVTNDALEHSAIILVYLSYCYCCF